MKWWKRWPKETFQNWGWIMVVDEIFQHEKKTRDKKHLHFTLHRFKGVAKLMGFDLFQIKVCSSWSHPSAGDGEPFPVHSLALSSLKWTPGADELKQVLLTYSLWPAGRITVFDVHFDVWKDVVNLWKDLTKIGFGILATALCQYTPMPGPPGEEILNMVNYWLDRVLWVSWWFKWHKRWIEELPGGGMVIHHNQVELQMIPRKRCAWMRSGFLQCRSRGLQEVESCLDLRAKRSIDDVFFFSQYGSLLFP